MRLAESRAKDIEVSPTGTPDASNPEGVEAGMP
jgi:hypothetical protein